MSSCMYSVNTLETEPVLTSDPGRRPSQILSLGLLTIVILVSPKFQGRQWRTLRVCIFVGTGLSGLAPLAHGIVLFGFQQMILQSGMPYYIGEGFLLLLGALFYTVSALLFPTTLPPTQPNPRLARNKSVDPDE